jgi:HEAT repeat protein
LNEPISSERDAAQNPSWTIDPGSAAARALGRIAPETADAPRVIAALIEIVRSGPPSRRGPAAAALGEFGPTAGEAVPVLIKAINHASDGGEASIAGALGDIAPGTSASDQAVAAILPVLESKHWTSRYMAVQALGKFGANAATAIPRIRALKNDPDADIKRAAAEALLAIDNASSP